MSEIDCKKVEDDLSEILEDTRGKLEEIKIDNPDYDPEFAKIGKEEVKKEDDEKKSGSEEENKIGKQTTLL